ncbi:MAG: molecular chaperone DnaJ [Candidatus Pacebacteria bacterium]|nr:molecular chaperone DnaJ [Candidatus Paceibacterota bacterium]
MKKDYYEILGVQKTSTQDEIKKAYYKLAHKYHPDKGEGDESKFKEINEAYQILGDKDKRAQYDRFGTNFNNAQGGFGGFNNANINWEDFAGFDNLEDIFDIFGGGFGGFRQKEEDLRRGSDLEMILEIPLESVLKDQKKEINISKMTKCSRCDGTGAEPGTNVKECFTCRGKGRVQQFKKTILGTFTQYTICPECGGEGVKPEKPCNVCNGEGRIKKEETITIDIPAGVDNNQIIKVKGKGDAGKRGGKAGDLYIRIAIQPNTIFKRKGDDVYIKTNIAFSQAVLGDKISIPSLEGKNIIMKIPQGIDSGKIMKISGKGIPHFRGLGKGDMYVQINIDTPQKLTKKQKDLLEELRREGL